MKLLINYGDREKSYLHIFRTWAKRNNAGVVVTGGQQDLKTLEEKAMIYECDMIIVSDQVTLKGLVGTGTPQDWAGSVLWQKYPILLLPPLGHTKSTATGKWLMNMYLGKIKKIVEKKDKGAEEFDIVFVNNNQKAQEALNELSDPTYDFIVEDIETSRQNGITSIAFTPIGYNPVAKGFYIDTTWVFNLSQKELYPLWRYCREINQLPVRKVFHNGCFDAFHLVRWWMEPVNYYIDTEYMWHSWYAELRKSLAFVSNTVLWDARFWKFEAEKSPLLYNAKDTINTARILIYMLENMPEWAWKNYSKLAPNIAPVTWCSFEGFKVDRSVLDGELIRAQSDKERLLRELKEMAATPEFNPGSWQQVSTWLYKILRAHKPKAQSKQKSAAGTDEKTLNRVAMQHPLFARVIGTLLAYRGMSKAISTYYTARLTEGNRLLYSLHLDGTETERFSATNSALYAPLLEGQTISKQQNYGVQLQNIPPYMKTALQADEGFLLIDIDKNKSEAHCVAKLSRDEQFWNDLKGELDFYLALGNRLFGLNLIDKKDPLRQASKKVNHSSSYMAGGDSLIDSITPLEAYKYMAILKFKGTLSAFGKYCINLMLKAYPKRRKWWDRIKTDAALHGYIDCPDGHRRKVFGDPREDHGVWRSLVAHQPQHLSVAGLNIAFWRVWYELQWDSKGEFRLKGQVHDSLIAQAVEGKVEEYRDKMLEVMDIPQMVDGEELRIPLEAEILTHWKEKK